MGDCTVAGSDGAVAGSDGRTEEEGTARGSRDAGCVVS